MNDRANRAGHASDLARVLRPRGVGGRREDRRANRPGFTLVEVTLAVMVVTVVGSMALPKLASAERDLELQGAAQQFATDLTLARVEAVKRNETVQVTRQGANGYVIEHVGVRELPGGVEFAAGAPTVLEFEPFGPPTAGIGAYTLELAGETLVVEVKASGFAVVQ